MPPATCLLLRGEARPLATEENPVPVGVSVDRPDGLGFLPHTQVIIRDNRFRYVEGATGAFEGYAIDVKGAQSVIISDNIVETIPVTGAAIRTETPNPPALNVSFFDNRTPEGTLLDSASDRYFSTLDVPAEDALMLACFEKS